MKYLLSERKPHEGEMIWGFNEKGQRWAEQWDSREPVGQMIGWTRMTNQEMRAHALYLVV